MNRVNVSSPRRYLSTPSFGMALAVAAASGAGITVTSWWSGRGQKKTQRQRLERLQTYLMDHLAGSDTAYALVRRLSHLHDGNDVGVLAADLVDQFAAERNVVIAILESLQHSPRSLKRMATKAGGLLVSASDETLRGALGLFRAVEALAIGVQGKRLLWRMLDDMDPDGGDVFKLFEEQAVRQWQQLDVLRRRIGGSLFDDKTHPDLARL